MPDLEQRAVRPRAIEHGWNDVAVLRGGAPQVGQAPLDEGRVPLGPDPREPGPLGGLGRVPTLRIRTGASASSTKSFSPTMVRRPSSSSAWNRAELEAICRWNHPDSMARTTPPCASISAKSPSASRSSPSVSAST
jgi:hypothetical protein